MVELRRIELRSIIDNVFLVFGVFVAETPAFRRGEEADLAVFPPLPKKGVCFVPVRRYTLNREVPIPNVIVGFLVSSTVPFPLRTV